MKGHIAKKGRRYYPVVDVGRDPVSGARRQKWHRGHGTKREAERALVEILGQLEHGSYITPSRATVATFLAEWLPAIEATIRPSTWASYESHARLYLVPKLGSIELQRLSPAAVNALYGQLLAKGLSAGTVRRIHATLHRALRDAVRWNRIARNVADQADVPRHRPPEMRTWTAEQLGAFLEIVERDRLAGLWRVLATTGMRRGEALALQWSDADLEVGRLAVRRAAVRIGGRIRYAEPKSPKSRRSIALDRRTVQALRDHAGRQAHESAEWGEAYQEQGLMFCREDGSALDPGRISHRFATLVASAGLPPIRLHDLRHTHATLALSAGIHPKVVSERLGHSTVSLTLDLYSHTVPALEEEAAERVAALVSAARAV